jgi:uncharacterized protein (TIGR03000 family)
MYSMVMVVAMTAAPATPDWGFKHGGCWGNGGCSGYSCGGCCGGWSCGGGCGGCRGGGWGFCGFCGGGGWGGCHGGCTGCCGGGWGCHGSVSVYSGCCGGGCCGGYPVAPYGGLAFSGCCGGHQAFYTGCGGYGNYVAPVGPTAVGYDYYGAGSLIVPAAGYPGAAGSVTPATGTPGTGGSKGTSGGTTSPGAGSSGSSPNGISVPGTPEAVGFLPVNRAQVVVRVPAEAKLFAEGQSTTLTGTERVFLTPEIAAGRDFQYTLKVETESGSETKAVVVRAGHRTVVDFTTVSTTAASPVTVNLPAKAKLFVDGVAATATGGTHAFRTPELPKGKPFVYEFRVDVELADGKTESISKKVTFNAGEPVLVDFVEPTAVRTAAK